MVYNRNNKRDRQRRGSQSSFQNFTISTDNNAEAGYQGQSSYSGSRNSSRGDYRDRNRSTGYDRDRRGGKGRGGSRQRGPKPSGIHPKHYVQASQPQPEVKPAPTIFFKDLQLSPVILKSIQSRGYEHPTAIQAAVIPQIMQGKDVLAIAQTGGGKTGGFIIPLLEKTIAYRDQGKPISTLVIAPTRELAFQIEKELNAFDTRALRIFSVVCVGGMSMFDQVRKLRKPNQFIIGTPGRLKDLSEKGKINLSSFNTVVLDEVDRMLDMGFVDDITTILQGTPSSRQSLFFSATFDKAIRPLVERFSNDIVNIELDNPEPSKFVDQDIVHVGRDDSKITVLANLIADHDMTKTLVFTNTKRETEFVAKKLHENGHAVDYLHGGKTQNHRTRTLNGFKQMKKGILVATDVAARGIDVSDITHVINYDEPDTLDTYIHRIGRTGRGGNYGKAFTLVRK